METIYSGIVVTKLLQHELLVKSVNTIAGGIVSSVSHITQNEHQINDCFKKLDLHAELETITSFVNEIAEKEKFKESKTVQRSLHNINEILTLISEDLETVKRVIEEHKAKYFQSMRSCDLSLYETQIIEKKQTLDKRFERLLNVATVIGHL